MIEIFAWLSVHPTYADADTLAPDHEKQIMAQIGEILRRSGCGIKMQYRNGQPCIQTAYAANHRSAETDALIGTYCRIAETAAGSYGVLYLRDDEDKLHHNDMQVYKFRRGTVTLGIEPDFSLCIPKLEDAVCIPEEA